MITHPYVGLRAFNRDESAIFFGREEHTDALLDALARQQFLAVVGLSGSGKSSLVKCGLIPALESGYLSGAGTHWCIADFRPSNDPFKNLATSLCEAFQKFEGIPPALSPDALTQLLRNGGAFSLHEYLAAHPLPKAGKLLLICDQFEELFRYREQHDNAQAAAFVALLLASSRAHTLADGQISNGIYLVLTMRSDFLGECAQFVGLAESINQGLYLTPRLNREQLRLAIEEPALIAGGEADPALVVQLLEDVGNNPDQLPLLQHVLMRLWDDGQNLTLDHYRTLGGLSVALDNHADEAFNELNTVGKKVAETLFRALTERNRDKQEIRRPVKAQAVLDMLGESTDWNTIVKVIDTFRLEGRNFLMPPPSASLTLNTMLDISHESLMRQWQKLITWMEDEGQKAKVYWRLLDAAQGSRELWYGTDLALALEWQTNTKPNAEWAKRYGNVSDFYEVQNFLSASKKKADKKIQRQITWREERQKIELDEALRKQRKEETEERRKQDEAEHQRRAVEEALRKEKEEERERKEQERESYRRYDLKQAQKQKILYFIAFLISACWAFWGWREQGHAEQEAKNALQAQDEARKSEKLAKTAATNAELAERNAINLAESTIENLLESDENRIKKYIQDVFDIGQKDTLLVLVRSLITQNSVMNNTERQNWREMTSKMNAEDISRLTVLLFKQEKSKQPARYNKDFSALENEVRGHPQPTNPTSKPEMVFITSGGFDMGCNKSRDLGCIFTDESPLHSVELKAFQISKYEVTVAQFRAFVQDTEYKTSAEKVGYCLSAETSGKRTGYSWRKLGDNYPVACISWEDTQAFIAWLNKKQGDGYRLPTEAEWEYACRVTDDYSYCGSNNLDQIAWYGGNSRNEPHTIGRKQANAFGLFDMTGNVAEWVADCMSNYQYTPKDGTAYLDCMSENNKDIKYVFRGGSWLYTSGDTRPLRAAYRSFDSPTKSFDNIGFRLARTIKP